MSQTRGLFLALIAWALIYLPGLGTLEIKGEEGRRILPAMTMLQTGNFIVPQVGSDPYFRKPPLVNWLVAASFKVFGARNEWTARIPSALCVLAVAIAFVTIARGSLGPNGSVIAALIWMTNFGMIEKGRLIEIEALYVSLCGLAVICWLSWWVERRSKWLTWIVPWIFLGLGLLAKGPLHLLFFYAVVLAVLFRAAEVRALWNGAHFLGLLLMLGIFAAWAIPCLQMMEESEVADTWLLQFSGRLRGDDFKLSGWIMNIPRGLGYFLPWVLFLPLLKTARFATARNACVATGLAWGIGISFLAVSLLPGSLSRYTMPLLVPATWLTAMLLTAEGVELPRWLKFRRSASVRAELRLPLLITALVSIALALYAMAIMPWLKKREKVRSIATQINAALPPAETLYAVDPDYQPFLFYVREPIIYLARGEDAPGSARYVLVEAEKEKEIVGSKHWSPLTVRPIFRQKDYRNKEIVLLKVGEGS